MTRLEREVRAILEDAAANRATTQHIVDELDRRIGDFSMAELETTLADLRAEGVVRVHRPRASVHSQLVEYRGDDGVDRA